MNVLNSEFLLQKFAGSVIFRPLMDLAYIAQSADASQYYNANGFRYAAKIPVIFLCCFYFFKVFY